MRFDVTLCPSQLQTLQVFQEATALTLGHVALAPVCWQVAQDVLDPGGDNRDEEAQQPPPALPGNSSRPGGRPGGVDFADEGLNRDHNSNPD